MKKVGEKSDDGGDGRSGCSSDEDGDDDDEDDSFEVDLKLEVRDAGTMGGNV